MMQEGGLQSGYQQPLETERQGPRKVTKRSSFAGETSSFQGIHGQRRQLQTRDGVA